MNARMRNLALWIVIGLFMILLFNLFNVSSRAPETEMIFSDFMAKLDKGEVNEVTIKENDIRGVLKDGSKFRTYTVNYPDLVKILRDKNVRITARPSEVSPWYAFLVSWAPIVLFVALWIF